MDQAHGFRSSHDFIVPGARTDVLIEVEIGMQNVSFPCAGRRCLFPRHCERSLGGSHAADSDMAIHVARLHGLPRRYAPRNDEKVARRAFSKSVCLFDQPLSACSSASTNIAATSK